MEKIMQKFIIAALLGTAFSLPAHALLVNNSALIPTPSASINFEAFDGFITTGPELVSPEVIFTGDAGSQLGAFIADLGQNGLWGAGNKFAAAEFLGELRFTFAAGLVSRGAGAFVNHYADDMTPFAVEVSAYGVDNQIIETYRVEIDPAADSFNDGLFVGILRDTADIRSISFRGVAVVDDFTYATPVPEPEAFAMLLAGLVLMGTAARRRKAN